MYAALSYSFEADTSAYPACPSPSEAGCIPELSTSYIGFSKLTVAGGAFSKYFFFNTKTTTTMRSNTTTTAIIMTTTREVRSQPASRNSENAPVWVLPVVAILAVTALLFCGMLMHSKIKSNKNNYNVNRTATINPVFATGTDKEYEEQVYDEVKYEENEIPHYDTISRTTSAINAVGDDYDLPEANGQRPYWTLKGHKVYNNNESQDRVVSEEVYV
eukprot:m.61247 g.61247  ORF g.61247 m.61247 type:complete len:217 (+) comp11390_c0_seq1:232-882(+)